MHLVHCVGFTNIPRPSTAGEVLALVACVCNFGCNLARLLLHCDTPCNVARTRFSCSLHHFLMFTKLLLPFHVLYQSSDAYSVYCIVQSTEYMVCYSIVEFNVPLDTL